MSSLFKRVLVGRPIATDQQDHQRLRKIIALATFSSDAISSTAYATQEILLVVAVGGSSLTLGLSKLVPISIVVAVLLAVLLGSIAMVVFFERAQREIPIQYSRRQVGRRVYGGQTAHLPLKVNTAGVIPMASAKNADGSPVSITMVIPLPSRRSRVWINTP